MWDSIPSQSIENHLFIIPNWYYVFICVLDLTFIDFSNIFTVKTVFFFYVESESLIMRHRANSTLALVSGLITCKLLQNPAGIKRLQSWSKTTSLLTVKAEYSAGDEWACILRPFHLSALMTTVPSLPLGCCFTCNNGLMCDSEARQLWVTGRKFALNSLKFALSSV